MKNIIRQLLVFFVFVVSLNLAAQTLPVITGQVKCQGRGVANVVVTNGFDCVSTDVAGKYTIPYHRDARFVYVTTPAGYLPQRDFPVASLCFINALLKGLLYMIFL